MKKIIFAMLMLSASLFAQSDSISVFDKIGFGINVEQDVNQYRYVNFRVGYYDTFSAFSFVTNTDLIGFGVGKDNFELYGFIGKEKYYGFGLNYSVSAGQILRVFK